MSKVLQYLVIHCTATPEGREVTADEIRRWHTAPPPQGRGWQKVGYAVMIHLDGSIETLAPYNEDEWVDPWEVTNGARGYNQVSRHIVYVGGLSRDGKRSKDTRTEAQKRALRDYIKSFHKKHPKVKIVGHREINPHKACPSFDVQEFLESIDL